MDKMRWMAALAAAGCLAAGVVGAQSKEAARPKLERWLKSPQQSAATAGQTIEYGSDLLQTLTFWKPTPDGKSAASPAPLVVFVHGGGWQRGDKDNATGEFKVTHYPGLGYAFASVNYRLVPDATVEQQAQDVAAALKALIDRAPELGIDRHRIVLMGHSAGAHLVALVGTDERYLRGAGLSFADLQGVIPIDGAAYDVPMQLQEGPLAMQRTYAQAFGDDPARQRALSPTLQAAAPNAPAFLLPHVQRPDGARQSDELAKALRAAGTPAQSVEFPGEGLKGHMEINRRLGDPTYAATPVVDAWLKERFGR